MEEQVVEGELQPVAGEPDVAAGIVEIVAELVAAVVGDNRVRRDRGGRAAQQAAIGFILRLIGTLYHSARQSRLGARLRCVRRCDQFKSTLPLLKRAAVHLRTVSQPRSPLGEACS